MNFLLEIKSTKQNILDSRKEFSKVQSLVGCAFLMALNIAAGSLLRIQVTPLLRIGFSSVFAAASAMLYGPLLTGCAGILCDTIKFLLVPDGPYFPGFALNEFLTGFIYGCFFYKKKLTIPRTIISRFCITLIINLILTSLWLNILYQSELFTSIRLIKNVLMYPFDVVILYVVLKAVNNVVKKR